MDLVKVNAQEAYKEGVEIVLILSTIINKTRS